MSNFANNVDFIAWPQPKVLEFHKVPLYWQNISQLTRQNSASKVPACRFAARALHPPYG